MTLKKLKSGYFTMTNIGPIEVVALLSLYKRIYNNKIKKIERVSTEIEKSLLTI